MTPLEQARALETTHPCHISMIEHPGHFVLYLEESGLTKATLTHTNDDTILEIRGSASLDTHIRGIIKKFMKLTLRWTKKQNPVLAFNKKYTPATSYVSDETGTDLTLWDSTENQFLGSLLSDDNSSWVLHIPEYNINDFTGTDLKALKELISLASSLNATLKSPTHE